MTASLSGEEFQRMQTQLLELRTQIYNLEEKNYKARHELFENNQQTEELKRELAKAQKVISRSKVAKDVDQLVQENDSLQNKLQTQEDEFRLQNETLMQELSSLVGSNDELSKELELVKAQHLSTSDLESQQKVIRLEAEITAMRKILSDHEKTIENNNGDQIDMTDSSSGSIEFKLKYETENEEKKMLQNRLREQEGEHREQLLKMQSEIDKLAEKLKKKQESFMQLQEEKERLYVESKKSIESLQDSKEVEISQLRNQFQSIQSQLQDALHLNDNFGDDDSVELESEPSVELIDCEKATFDCSFNETKLSLLNFQKKMNVLNRQLQNSNVKLKNFEEESSSLQLKVQELEAQKITLEEQLAEKTQLAEKRKNLMDEMNNHLLDTTNKHSKEIENLTCQLSDEQEALQKLFDKEKETKLKLVESRNEVQMLKEEIDKLKIARNGSDDKLKTIEDSMQKSIAQYEDTLKQTSEEHAESIRATEEKFQNDIKDLQVELEVARAEKTEFEEKVIHLQQDVKDSVDERKIHEKKGLAMVKDLKRQLQVERSRAEKLQERLQEILNDNNRSVDDILQSPGTYDKPKGDTSSISSWSYVSGGTADRENRDGTAHSDNSSGAGRDSPKRTSPTQLETETQSLLSKVAQLQQKNWTLEEKVNHLEMSNEALVDDVLKKTALIQFYCMEGRSDHHASVAQDKLTIKRIVDFIKDKGDENLREMNRRMQRMLEETLTKNMHLQKDIETLSNEVSRLSKVVEPSVDNAIQSAVFIESI